MQLKHVFHSLTCVWRMYRIKYQGSVSSCTRSKIVVSPNLLFGAHGNALFLPVSYLLPFCFKCIANHWTPTWYGLIEGRTDATTHRRPADSQQAKKENNIFIHVYLSPFKSLVTESFGPNTLFAVVQHKHTFLQHKKDKPTVNQRKNTQERL